MLSTGFSYAVAAVVALQLVLNVFFYWWMLRLANYCRDAVSYVQSENKRAVSLRRIAEIDATLTELSDSYDALYESNKKLRARITMRQNREKAKKPAESGPPPSSEAERAAYKAELREQAKSQGLLR